MSQLRISIALALLASCLFAGCQRAHRATGSESHFLAMCVSDAQCGPLFCITGMCSKPCTGDRECGALADDGACVGERAGMASQQICSVECSADRDCDAFGDGLRCESGRCGARKPASAADDPVKGIAGGNTQEPTRVGTGGSGGTNGNSGHGMAPSQPTTGLDPSTGAIVDMQPVGSVVGRGCDQSSPFMGDDDCLPPPAPGQGIQIHFGPNSYDDAAVQPWLFEPSEEEVRCVTFPMPSDADFAFAEWELSARPGVHSSIHLLDGSSGLYQICASPVPEAGWQAIPDQLRAPGTRVERLAAAPENEAIARRIPAHAPASSWLHHFNFTDKPLLLELWLNLYVPRAKPVAFDVPFYQRAVRLQPIPPGVEASESYSCTIQSSGRLLSLTTITTPTALDLDARLQRTNGEDTLLLHRTPRAGDFGGGPTTFRFDSVTNNPPMAPMLDWGFPGQVAFEPGDVLHWSCRVFNDGNSPLALPSVGALCDLAGSSTTPLNCVE